MTDTEQFLHQLVHDVRTPLGVAQGYVRMIREARLATPEQQERALAQTMTALGRIARLCDEADAFLAPAHASATTVSAARFVRAVEERADAAGLAIARIDVAATSTVRVGGTLDVVAEAVATVLSRAIPAGVRAPLQFETTMHELLFRSPSTGAPAEISGDDAPFDPWQGFGVSVALACRLVQRAGGRIRTLGDPVHTMTISFPLEVRP